MAKEPVLKIDGSAVPNVLEVSYALQASTDRDGRPTRRLMFSGIKIRRIGDAKTTLVNWAKDPTEKNRKGGEIEFFSNAGKATKKLTWKNGFIHSYDLRYDPQADHVEEEVVIQAEEISCGGLKIDCDWPDKGQK
jgi:hypothetical protein